MFYNTVYFENAPKPSLRCVKYMGIISKKISNYDNQILDRIKNTVKNHKLRASEKIDY